MFKNFENLIFFYVLRIAVKETVTCLEKKQRATWRPTLTIVRKLNVCYVSFLLLHFFKLTDAYFTQIIFILNSLVIYIIYI
jgi:hypothetical protein